MLINELGVAMTTCRTGTYPGPALFMGVVIRIIHMCIGTVCYDIVWYVIMDGICVA